MSKDMVWVERLICEILWTKPDGTKQTLTGEYSWSDIKERSKWGGKLEPGLYQLIEVAHRCDGEITPTILQGVRAAE